MSWTAVADESIRIEHGVYVFASCVIDDSAVSAATELMRTLEPRPGQRFHWRDREPHERFAAAHAAAELEALHIVVVGAPIDRRRQERARRKCLETLLFHLHQAGVSQLWLESRGQAADRRDQAAVRAARARQILQYGLLVDHAQPLGRPLMWLADLVAGAISAAEGGEPAYRDLLAPMLTEHRIDLT